MAQVRSAVKISLANINVMQITFPQSPDPAGKGYAGALGSFSLESDTTVFRTLPGAETADAFARLATDARWSRDLGESVALQPRIEPHGGAQPRLALAREGFDPLCRRIGQPLSIEDTSMLGLALARLLARMHARGLVHG